MSTPEGRSGHDCAQAHDDEMCMCKRCIARLLAAQDRYLQAWVRRALGTAVTIVVLLPSIVFARDFTLRDTQRAWTQASLHRQLVQAQAYRGRGGHLHRWCR